MIIFFFCDKAFIFHVKLTIKFNLAIERHVTWLSICIVILPAEAAALFINNLFRKLAYLAIGWKLSENHAT